MPYRGDNKDYKTIWIKRSDYKRIRAKVKGGLTQPEVITEALNALDRVLITKVDTIKKKE